MGLFKFRKNEVLDLTERYNRQKERLAELQANLKEPATTQASDFSFFGMASANSDTSKQQTESDEYSEGDDTQDRKKKLAKRLIDITTKLEELSNQIYHLQQRMEVVEKKMNLGNY